MSHKKVIELAIKFAEKTVMLGHKQVNTDKNNQLDDFIKQFKALLNEMEGDHMTIKIKRIDYSIQKEFNKLHHNLLELFKRIDNDNPEDGVQRIISFVFLKSTRTIINSLNLTIQKFLKENEIEFIPSKNFSQPRFESLKNLIKITTNAHNFLNSQKTISPDSEQLKNEKEQYVPISGGNDTTKVDKKL